MSVNLSTIDAAMNGFSVLMCLLAAILVLCLKLYKKLVYRLALYQVLSGLAFASVSTMEATFITYDVSSRLYGNICTAIGWLLLYTVCVKLLFTMWVTFHLFCFAVLHKNLKKLEVLYVVTSLLVPALIACVPLVTHTYEFNPSVKICYIYAANGSVAPIERLALWDGPAMFILMAASISMVVMVIKLASQVYRRSKYESIIDGDQFTKALKQLLPLAAFPVLSFIFEVPVLSLDIYLFYYSTPDELLVIFALYMCVSLWTMASGATVIIHISVARTCGRKRKRISASHSHTLFTQRVTTGSHVNSATRFSLPPASV